MMIIVVATIHNGNLVKLKHVETYADGRDMIKDLILETTGREISSEESEDLEEVNEAYIRVDDDNFYTFSIALVE
jgi:hypothetical protein